METSNLRSLTGYLWNKRWPAENGDGFATHSDDQITALRDKFFVRIRREVDGEEDHATAGGKTQTTTSSREVFPGNSCMERLSGRDRGDRLRRDIANGFCSEMQ